MLPLPCRGNNLSAMTYQGETGFMITIGVFSNYCFGAIQTFLATF